MKESTMTPEPHCLIFFCLFFCSSVLPIQLLSIVFEVWINFNSFSDIWWWSKCQAEKNNQEVWWGVFSIFASLSFQWRFQNCKVISDMYINGLLAPRKRNSTSQALYVLANLLSSILINRTSFHEDLCHFTKKKIRLNRLDAAYVCTHTHIYTHVNRHTYTHA